MIAPSHGVYVIEVCAEEWRGTLFILYYYSDANQYNTAMLLKETLLLLCLLDHVVATARNRYIP